VTVIEAQVVRRAHAIEERRLGGERLPSACSAPTSGLLGCDQRRHRHGGRTARPWCGRGPQGPSGPRWRGPSRGGTGLMVDPREPRKEAAPAHHSYRPRSSARRDLAAWPRGIDRATATYSRYRMTAIGPRRSRQIGTSAYPRPGDLGEANQPGRRALSGRVASRPIDDRHRANTVASRRPPRPRCCVGAQ